MLGNEGDAPGYNVRYDVEVENEKFVKRLQELRIAQVSVTSEYE
jgi:hypothetical protein